MAIDEIDTTTVQPGVSLEDRPKPKTDKEKTALWMDRISVAKRRQKSIIKKREWEKFIRQYKGHYNLTLKVGSGTAQRIPPINQVFSYVQSDIANMYFRDPYITVNPKLKTSIESAAIMEVGVNYWWRKLEMKEEMESQLMDADLVGHAWNKDGWVTTVKQSQEGDKVQTKIDEDKMFSKKVSWRDILFNISSKNPPKDSLWIAQRIVMPLPVAKEKYPSLKNLTGSISPEMNEKEFNKAQFTDDIRVAVLWEVYDAIERKIILLAEGHETFVKPEVSWPEHWNEFPFSMLWYYEMPDEAYPMSPIAPWDAQIEETNQLFGQALNHVKRDSRQIITKRGAFTESELDKYAEGVDGAMVEMEGTGAIRENFEVVGYGPVSQDVYMLLDRLAGISRETNGQPEFEKGGVTKTSSRTLGELQAIAAGARSRLDKRVDQLETHIETIAKHMIASMQANFDMEQMIRITGETPDKIIKALGDKFNPETQTIEFTKEDIQGDFDVEVRAGSTLPLNKETRMAILKNVLELALHVQGPLPPFAVQIILDLLKDFEMPKLVMAFEQQEQERQAQIKQQQQTGNIDDAKTVAEADKRNAQADNVEFDTALKKKELLTPLGEDNVV